MICQTGGEHDEATQDPPPGMMPGRARSWRYELRERSRPHGHPNRRRQGGGRRTHDIAAARIPKRSGSVPSLNVTYSSLFCLIGCDYLQLSFLAARTTKSVD